MVPNTTFAPSHGNKTVLNTSLLLTSILCAFSSSVKADSWTYEEGYPYVNQSLYYYTQYTDDTNSNPTFTEGFSWDTQTAPTLSEEQLANIAYTYGIYVKFDSPDQTPDLTFKDFSASIIGYEVPNSNLIGIYTVATDLNSQGQMSVNNVHLTFDTVSVKDQLAAIAADPSNLSVSNSSFTFSHISPSQDSLEIRGLSATAYTQETSSANVQKVSVTLSDSSANQTTGLYIESYNTATLQNNNLRIKNTTATNIRGLFSNQNNNVTVTNNEMTVDGGQFETVRAIDVTAHNNVIESLTVTDNHLTVSNVNDSDASVIGVHLEGYSGQDHTGLNVSNNVVELANSNIGSLIVAYSDNGSSQHFFNAGNAVRFVGVNTINGALDGFDQMEYTVNDSNAAEAVLTLNSTENYTFTDKTIVVNRGTGVQDGTNYKLIAVNGSSAQFTNTKVESQATFVNSEWNLNDFTLNDGETLSVRWGQSTEPGDPDTPVLDPDNPDHQVVTENSKTLSESRLGSVAFINQGAEFIADEGMAAMVNSSAIGKLSTFGAVHGGSSNYQTGSRVDVDGYTLVAGASFQIDPSWIVGAFIEAGWADSDSHVNRTKGEGDHDYYGLGVASRYLVNDSWYVDGSFRLGQSSTEFKGLYDGDSAKYDSDSFYVTAHIGTGYLFSLTDSINLDMYGRYLVTYLDGDDVSLHNQFNDKLDMDSTVTHAVRVGGRLTGSFCPYAGWKIGLAYEHVFDGDADSSVNGLNLEVPSLEGDTGIMELGVTMKPGDKSPWALDIGAKGYVGDREGVTGNMVVRYAF